MFMRDLSKDLTFLHLVSLRVRNNLEMVNVSKLKIQYPEMMLWILMLGGLCGLPASGRGWFATIVADSVLSWDFMGVMR